jgi:hypothetical protein
MGYSGNEWAEDMDDRKSTTGFVFYIENTTFTWSLKKRSIITLLTSEVEYVTAITCVCHSI